MIIANHTVPKRKSWFLSGTMKPVRKDKPNERNAHVAMTFAYFSGRVSNPQLITPPSLSQRIAKGIQIMSTNNQPQSSAMYC